MYLYSSYIMLVKTIHKIWKPKHKGNVCYIEKQLETGCIKGKEKFHE